MADLSLVTENYLATASETFADNLSGSIAASAGTVPVNSAAEYADGDVVVLTVEPGTANEATFVGVKDVGADQFIDCIWTEGNTAVGHDAGATIIDYDSATHYNLLSEAMQLIMNQDGTLKDDPIRTALGLSDASNDGWEVFPYTFSVSSGYAKGNGEYDLTVANQDVRSLLSVGMKLRLERNTTAPTQCADFEASSTQYAARASGSLTGTLSSITDDISVEAWIKPESYASLMTIASRYSSGGWIFRINASGQLALLGYNGATNNERFTSYVSVSLDKWQHVAGTMDLSGNAGTLYINGVSVTVDTSGGTGSISTFSALGDFSIGSITGAGQLFDGKIADVRVWSGLRSATEIRDNMNQYLTGSETNLIGYWTLNGNFNDSTSSANNLTASGGVVATNTDNPLSNTQYAIVTKVAYSSPNSTVTVFAGNSHMIPNMTLNSPYYSVNQAPYGFPIDRGLWRVIATFRDQVATTSNATWGNHNGGGDQLEVPLGAWNLGYGGSIVQGGATVVYSTLALTTSGTSGSALGSEEDRLMTVRSGAASGEVTPFYRSKPINLSAAAIYRLYTIGATTSANFDEDNQQLIIFAECAYL